MSSNAMDQNELYTSVKFTKNMMMKHNWSYRACHIIFYDLREQMEWAWRYRDDIVTVS